MSRTEDFDSEFWSDPDLEDLSIDAAMLYIWSWTNDRVGPAGLYKVTRRSLLESKVPADRLDAALAELATAEKVFYDGTYLWSKARVKRLRTRTIPMCRGIAKAVAKVPVDHPYREQFLARYGGQVWRSRDEVTTIAQELAALEAGHVPTDPHLSGTHPPTLIPKPKEGSHQDESWTHKGKGNGKGTGKGLPRGRGAGRGIEPAAVPSAQQVRYEAWVAEHFPGVPVALVYLIQSQLEEDGQQPTVEAIRSRLGEAAA